jgi:hypothetical protein
MLLQRWLAGTPRSDVMTEYISPGGSLLSLDVSVEFSLLSFADPASVGVIPSALSYWSWFSGSEVASDSLSSLSCVITNTLSSCANLGLCVLDASSLSSSSSSAELVYHLILFFTFLLYIFILIVIFITWGRVILVCSLNSGCLLLLLLYGWKCSKEFSYGYLLSLIDMFAMVEAY